jgi:hypothetical protein
MMFLKRWFGSLCGMTLKCRKKQDCDSLTHGSENFSIGQVVRYNFSEFREMPAVPFLLK